MTEPTEIAKRLRGEIKTVDNMTYALELAFPRSMPRLKDDAHCLIEWMKDAADALDAVGGSKQP